MSSSARHDYVKLVKMVARAFYEPPAIVVIDVLAIAPSGMKESELVTKVKLGVKQLRGILSMLQRDGLVETRLPVTTNDEDADDPEAAMSSALLIAQKAAQEQRARHIALKNTVFVVDIVQFVRVVKYRFTSMYESLTTRGGDAQMTYQCPNGECPSTQSDIPVVYDLHMYSILLAEVCATQANGSHDVKVPCQHCGVPLVSTSDLSSLEEKQELRRVLNAFLIPMLEQVDLVERRLIIEREEEKAREEMLASHGMSRDNLRPKVEITGIGDEDTETVGAKTGTQMPGSNETVDVLNSSTGISATVTSTVGAQEQKASIPVPWLKKAATNEAADLQAAAEARQAELALEERRLKGNNNSW